MQSLYVPTFLFAIFKQNGKAYIALYFIRNLKFEFSLQFTIYEIFICILIFRS